MYLITITITITGVEFSVCVTAGCFKCSTSFGKCHISKSSQRKRGKSRSAAVVKYLYISRQYKVRRKFFRIVTNSSTTLDFVGIFDDVFRRVCLTRRRVCLLTKNVQRAFIYISTVFKPVFKKYGLQALTTYQSIINWTLRLQRLDNIKAF